MSTLYELTGEMLELLSMLDDPDVEPTVWADTFEGLSGEFEDKADGYAKVIAEAKGVIALQKAEIDRITARKKTMENNIARMQKALEDAMRAVDKPKFKTALYSFGIQKNPVSLKLDEFDIDDIPAEYVKVTKEVDKAKVKDAIKEGKTFSWAELIQTEGLRIR